MSSLVLPPARSLIWSEEFTTLDPVRWQHNLGRWSANTESEFYTDAPTNSSAAGILQITARRETPPDSKPSPLNYTSARLSTRGLVDFTPPVRIQAMIRNPSAAGCFPAFWTMGDTPTAKWPDCGEIDIMEQLPQYATAVPPWSFLPTTLHGPHADCSPGEVALGNTYRAPNDLSGNYHRYGIDWWPDRIDFHLDSQIVWSVSQTDYEARGGNWTPFSGAWPHYLIVNVAVVNPHDTDPFPKTLSVDWIRAWSL